MNRIKYFYNKFQRLFAKPPKQIEADLFIKRLRCSVVGDGMLPDGNIYLMDFAIRNMPQNGIVFEIGSYGGLSTNLMLHLLSKYNRQNDFFGCDAWIYEGYNDNGIDGKNHIDGRKDIERTAYTDHIKNSFIASARLLHPKKLPFTCHTTSDDFFEKWDKKEALTDVFGRPFHIHNEKIAFCYIDGDHSLEQTRKDFENVSSKLLRNGFVLIDDSAKHLPYGSAKFVKEVLKNPDFKLVDANPNYLFQKIK